MFRAAAAGNNDLASPKIRSASSQGFFGRADAKENAEVSGCGVERSISNSRGTTEPPTVLTPAQLTAQQMVTGTKSSGLPIGQVASYNETHDHNQLLGRPNQCPEKVNFADPRLA
jgi:hypothetical protein